MTIIPRFYGQSDDLPRIIRLAQTIAARRVRPVGFQVGDLVWRMARDPQFAPQHNVILWEYPHGALAAVALLYPFGQGYAADLLVGPLGQEGIAIEQAMWAWLEELIWSRTAPATLAMLFTSVLECDAERAEALRQRGFVRGTGCYGHMLLSLGELASAPPSPDGFSVRCTTAGEAQAWVRLYQQAINPRYTMDAYERLRHSSAYTPELNLVAVAPDGSLAGLALCWLDEANLSGQIEPLAILPEHRQKGVGRVVVYETLKRLRAHEAKWVLACTGATNTPARNLYASLGFETAAWEYDFVKNLVSP